MKSPRIVETIAQDVGENDGVKVGENVGVKLSKNQKLILQLLSEDKELSMEKLAEKVGVTTRSIERNISQLKEKGFLKRIGPDRTGYWEITP